MANDNEQMDRTSCADLQKSQSGGDSGLFGGNRDQQQSGQGGIGGQQMGGGARDSDSQPSGGSSGGGGGYGNAQNQLNHQGQQEGELAGYGSHGGERHEAFDEAQGGGRGADSVSETADERSGGSSGNFDEEAPSGSGSDELQRDQQEHRDRGQRSIGGSDGN